VFSDVSKERLDNDPTLVGHAEAAFSESVEIVFHMGRNTFFLNAGRIFLCHIFTTRIKYP
jgi:hypothetical protein